MTDGEVAGFQTLGNKTLFILFLRRAFPTVTLLVLLFLLEPISRAASEPLNSIIPDISLKISSLAQIAANIAAYVSVLLVAFFILISWLEYTHYIFAYGSHAFIIHRGIFNIEEYSIPYNKIQNVEIERPLIYRIMGVSILKISTASREDRNDNNDATEGFLEPIDTAMARRIQEQLLHHSNIQEVMLTKP